MSTRSIVFAAAILAGGLLSSGASAVEGIMAADAPMRVGPGDNFAEIGTVEAGAALKIQGCHTGLTWCLVRSSGRSGWVPGSVIRIGGFSKATSYFDPYAPVSLEFQFFDDGTSGGDVSGSHSFPTPPFSRFHKSRFSDKQLAGDFRSVDRRNLSDKQLPSDFRSTLHTRGLRLHKKGFRAIFGD